MKILICGSHADDAEIALGGYIAKETHWGSVVQVVIMTPSDYTNYDGKILRSTVEAYVEGEEALNILGVSKTHWLDFPTKDVPYDSSSVEALNRIIDNFQPDRIFCHHPCDTHQAHKNTGLAVTTAARNYNNIYYYEPFPPSGRSYVPFKPQLYINITGFLDKKIASLKAHKSQYTKYGDKWIDAVIARAKLRGYECGMDYAECCEILRELI